MPDDTKQTAWAAYCRKLKPLGVDPYDSEVSADDPRREEVQAIVAEFEAATTHTPALPPKWEGHQPIEPVDSLLGLADYLQFQWKAATMSELGGQRGEFAALHDVSRAIRNAFHVLVWMGVDDHPEPPPPTHDLKVVKQQIVDLERWVRRKHESGWKPSLKAGKSLRLETANEQRKRKETPDDSEANLRIKKYLDDHPDATIREVAAAVEIAVGRVQKLDAWRRRMAERRAKKPPPKKAHRPLTAEMMLNTRGREDDPAAKVMKDDAVWQWLLEQADENRRGELHLMNEKNKAELIELAREQYDSEQSEVDD